MESATKSGAQNASEAAARIDAEPSDDQDELPRPADLSSAATDAKRAKAACHRRLNTNVIRPLASEGFLWPSYAEIERVQQEHEHPREAEHNENGIWTVNGKSWIPDDAHELLERLMIIARCGSQGHRGIEVMSNQLQAVFAIDRQVELTRRFYADSLLCLHVKGGDNPNALERDAPRSQAKRSNALGLPVPGRGV